MQGFNAIASLLEVASSVVVVTNLAHPKAQKVAKVAIVKHGACVTPDLLLELMEG